MTCVMSGFCGWAVALCVDTWKLPGTWGRCGFQGCGRSGLGLGLRDPGAARHCRQTALGSDRGSPHVQLRD